jgi:hypothetical protein
VISSQAHIGKHRKIIGEIKAKTVVQNMSIKANTCLVVLEGASSSFNKQILTVTYTIAIIES